MMHYSHLNRWISTKKPSESHSASVALHWHSLSTSLTSDETEMKNYKSPLNLLPYYNPFKPKTHATKNS